jgi:acetyl esterase/lipase
LAPEVSVASGDKESFSMAINDLGPELFDPRLIDDETLAMNERVERALNDAPARWETDVQVERSLSPGGGILPTGNTAGNASWMTVAGPGGELRIRVIPPASGSPDGLYLHFHGGGYSFGAADRQDGMLALTAERANVVALSVDYRLAPEHPYPAAHADAEAVAWWLVGHGNAEFGTDRIVLGGESAGSHVALSTALRLRDRHEFAGLAGLNLSQGGYDMRRTPGARAATRRLVLDARTYASHLDRFLRDADREDPEVSPIFAELHDLPPALLTVGTLDPMLEDCAALYVRLLVARSRAELAVYPGGIHGFTLFDTALGRSAALRIDEFIASVLTQVGEPK